MKIIKLSLFVLIFCILIGCSRPTPKYYYIEGVIIEVNFFAETSSFNVPDIQKTIITFENNRIVVFNNISNEVFQIGVKNRIIYNGHKRIVRVEITEQ